MKMFKKKDKEDGMDPLEKEARMTAIQAMRKMADDEMTGKLKKVTVASDSPKGLEEGLAKAKELVAGHEPMLEQDPEDHEDGMDLDEEAEEDQEEENEGHGGSGPSDFDGLSEEELDAKLEQLMKLKAKKGIKSL